MMNYVDLTSNCPVDYAQLLQQCGNRPGEARQEIGLFVSHVAGRMDELQTAFELQDFESVIVTTSAIKETAAMACGNMIGDAAEEILTAALTENYNGAVAAFPELQSQVIRLQEWAESSHSAL